MCSKHSDIPAMREEERAQLEAELETIQDHIRFTKEHIDQLTVKFARFKPPPQLYLQVRIWTTRDLNLKRVSSKV